MIAYFIRHGRTEHPRDQAGVPLVYGPEASLTPEGKARIVEIAGSILHREGRPFDRLVASPYQRALQTARIIAEVMGLVLQRHFLLGGGAASWQEDGDHLRPDLIFYPLLVAGVDRVPGTQRLG